VEDLWHADHGAQPRFFFIDLLARVCFDCDMPTPINGYVPIEDLSEEITEIGIQYLRTVYFRGAERDYNGRTYIQLLATPPGGTALDGENAKLQQLQELAGNLETLIGDVAKAREGLKA
jgi:hypothetical protein